MTLTACSIPQNNSTSSMAAGIDFIPELLGRDRFRWYREQLVIATLVEHTVQTKVLDIRVSALGSFRVNIDGAQLDLRLDASRKVFAMLVLSDSQSCDRETIAGTIWPDSTRSKSLANLRQTILSLKNNFQFVCGENSPLQADPHSLSLDNCSITLDTAELIATIKRKEPLQNFHQITKVIAEGFMPELRSASDIFIEWVESRESTFIKELKEVLQNTIETVTSSSVQLQYAELLAELDPSNELACRTNMRRYHENGEKAKALKCYSDLWKLLEEEFDVEPSSSTQELAVAIKIDEGQSTDIDLSTQVINRITNNVRHGELVELNAENNKKGASSLYTGNQSQEIVPRIAVIPFQGRGVEKEHQVIGEVLADDLINVFSKCKTVTVISRLSTTVFSGLTGKNQTIDMLGVQYLMTGSYRIQAGKIVLDVEFSCAETDSILWQKRFKGDLDSFLRDEHPFVEDALHGMGISMMANELRKTNGQPLERLNDYSILISAIALMHRLTIDSFRNSRKLFEALISRNPKNSLPYVYLSMWYVLKVAQGWSESPGEDGAIAVGLSSKALDLDPFLSLTHTLHGAACIILNKNLDLAKKSYTTALEYNQSDSLAWLLKGTLYAFQGKGEEAVSFTSQAMSISPFDPHRYMYYALAGSAALSADKYEDAIALAEQSLRLNREHASTLRVLAIALWKIGKEKDSKEATQRLLSLQPTLTVSTWLRDTPCADYPIANDFASVLIKTGVPK